MIQNQKPDSISGLIVFTLALINAIILRTAYTGNERWYWVLVLSIPLLIIAIRDIRQKTMP